jgi:hypothetical protein
VAGPVGLQWAGHDGSGFDPTSGLSSRVTRHAKSDGEAEAGLGVVAPWPPSHEEPRPWGGRQAGRNARRRWRDGSSSRRASLALTVIAMEAGPGRFQSQCQLPTYPASDDRERRQSRRSSSRSLGMNLPSCFLDRMGGTLIYRPSESSASGAAWRASPTRQGSA